jgi:tetratricopeptide (TPR) repeat protein
MPDAKTLATNAKRARALMKLSGAQRDLGSFEAALGPAQEAVDMLRLLSSARQETFLPELAGALDHLGNVQGDLGKHDAALVSAMEAMDAYRGLAKARPETYLPQFAITLNHLSLRLQRLGRHKEALPLAQGAIEWLWPYYERFPDVHTKHVGTMFSVLVALHEDLGSRLDTTWAERLERYAKESAGEPKKAVPEKNAVGKKKRR